MSSEGTIPPGWRNVRLGDLVVDPKADLVDGPFGSNLRSAEYRESGVPVLKIQNIKANRFIRSKLSFVTERKAAELARHSFVAGDLIITKLGDPLGLCCEVPHDLSAGIFVADLIRLRPNPEVVIKPFLLHAINSRFVQQQFKDITKGTTRPRVNLSIVRDIALLLPPLAEQARIVAKIEELFSELDKGVENLKRAKAQLAVYRHAVLKQAFEGKLTADWRSKQEGGLGQAADVIARIQREREAVYNQNLLKWEHRMEEWKRNGPGRRQPPRPPKPDPFTKELTDGAALPEGWTMLRLGEIVSEAVLGKMLDEGKNVGESRPYLGNIDVRWGTFDLSGLKSIRIEPSEIERYRVEAGDLVICEGGEPGRCAVWKGAVSDVFLQKALHRVRFTVSYSPRFAYYYLLFIAQSQRLAAYFTGTTIKHLTGTSLAKIPFPLCSLPEQHEVVRHLDEADSAMHEMAGEVDTNLAKSEALRQSILKKAFSGRLVPQDLDGEPASTTLARASDKPSSLELPQHTGQAKLTSATTGRES